MKKNKLEKHKFVVIGGGTGTFSVLYGLKKYTKNIKAIVTMADSGGSARKERDEWGLLPSSDVRKSLLALADISSEDNLILRKLFQYRYSEGSGIRGMSFGNLLLVALTRILGSQSKAIEKAGDILQVHGEVLPVTWDKVDLVANYEDGTTVIGEHFIDEPIHNGAIKITKLTTKPKAKMNIDVKKAIEEADSIIMGPGGFYTTLLSNLIVEDVINMLEKSKAKKIFILNLMTEYGQTYNFSASNFLDELDKYYNITNLDYVIANSSKIPVKILQRYRSYHAVPVKNDLQKKNSKYKIIESDLISNQVVKKQKGDILKRSLIRHDPDKIAHLCMKILNLI